MKDIMEAVLQARPAHLSGDGSAGPEVREAELSRALMQPHATGSHATGSRTAEGGRWRSRIVILPAAVIGLAGAVALAVALVGGTQPGTPSGTQPSPSPQAAGGNGTPAFLTAATMAQTQPTGAYWYTDVIDGQSYLVHQGYAIIGAASEDFSWTAIKASGGNAFFGRDLPARPVTEKDAAAWRAAGSPASFRVFSNDHYATYTTKAGPWRADTPGKGGRFYLPGNFPARGLTSAQIQGLPSDPAALTRLFFRAKYYSGAPDQVLRASEIFAAPLSPAVHAGVMRALAEQPGIRQLGVVTDALGRRGIAIGTDATGAGSGPVERQELIFDQKTGAYLGTELVLVRPGGEYRAQAPGFVISYQLMRSSGWTDAKPAMPRTLPFK